jgi:hypothetical protein
LLIVSQPPCFANAPEQGGKIFKGMNKYYKRIDFGGSLAYDDWVSNVILECV